MLNKWNNFKQGNWMNEINVRDFINTNYKYYDGDDSFLASLTTKTKAILEIVNEAIKTELEMGKIKVDLENISGIDNFKPGYIDKKNEVIVGLQTDELLKRMINPYGGIRMAKQALLEQGYTMNGKIDDIFSNYRKTHNAGVFSAYTDEMKAARSAGLLTGLPDAYGRGRIIGDYRRIPLYGLDYLIEVKRKDLKRITVNEDIDESIRLREEVSEQIIALNKIRNMSLSYGIDMAHPAKNAKEAIQFLYFGYLAGVKENNGAAMSLGKNTTFLDIYIERDLQNGIITEEEAQELIDQFVIKLRVIRHLRTSEYDELFAGDPTWITETIGGMGLDGKTLVTKTAYRFIHTLTNLGSSPEPNITISWSDYLPENFKKYCAKISIFTNSIQYENDDLMKPIYGDDYGIACCVSAMELGKRMQLFGARCNLAKALLYTINGGIDEVSGKKVISGIEKIDDEVLSFDKILPEYFKTLSKIAKLYVNTMNVIHYMHDKYAYESSQMALHDTEVKRFMAFGIAGTSVVADSLSAIKYATVKPIRNENGIAIDFEIEGEFPKYGNDDDDVDLLAVDVIKYFSDALKDNPAYRKAEHTLSILTITSNVVYGKKTGSTPDGRKHGEPFAPGANPMHGRDTNGALASLNSVAKIPYKDVCQDGISNTFSIIPNALGHTEDVRISNLVGILDGYFVQGGFHLNVNVLNRELLIDAMNNPEKYPSLTIRVSGYAVNFNRLSRQQQQEVINRTFHESI